MGIAYYAVFDPLQQIQEEGQMDGQPLKVLELSHLVIEDNTPVDTAERVC